MAQFLKYQNCMVFTHSPTPESIPELRCDIPRADACKKTVNRGIFGHDCFYSQAWEAGEKLQARKKRELERITKSTKCDFYKGFREPIYGKENKLIGCFEVGRGRAKCHNCKRKGANGGHKK